jgi:flavin reductase (DIM6/NTAB) family NADH-FMN oxidoreductase RutF
MDLDDECAGTDNLAPFSQFQNVTFDPPTVLFIANQRTAGGRKDSVVNAESQGEFVWNMATYALRDAVNITSEEFGRDIDEFERAGLKKAPSRLVRPPRGCSITHPIRMQILADAPFAGRQ